MSESRKSFVILQRKTNDYTMKKKFFLLFLCIFCSVTIVNAQETEQGNQQRPVATSSIDKSIAKVQSLYNANMYQEAFDLLRSIDQQIATSNKSDREKAADRYKTSKERMLMYMKMHRSTNAADHLANMERLANQSADDQIINDLLYNKTIYYYTFGQTEKGNAVFKEMATKLTAQKEYDKVDEVYQTLIANGRKSNSANLVAQSYSSYLAWKDSTNALKAADEVHALKQQIADNEAAIAEKDSSLTTRQAIIIALIVLAAALAGVLVVGGIALMRFILLTRKQKKTILMANESNAMKAKFISNISAQLEPTLKKLDSKQPEVKALLSFANHIQTLSDLENNTDKDIELEDIQMQQYCEELMDQIRNSTKKELTLTVNAPKMNAKIYPEYVSHILLHLLNNAVEYAPEGGKVTLEFKKRGQHVHQFLVSDTGENIPEEQRNELFKPFREILDLTKGDGLGLPICRQMALNMNGDLDIDPTFTKGTRFVLELHA